MATTQKPTLRQQARRIQVDDIAGLWNLDDAIRQKFKDHDGNDDKVEENFAQIYEACQYQLARNNIPRTFEARYHFYMAPVVIRATNAAETGDFDDPRWHCRQAKSICEGLRPKLPENGLDVEALQKFLSEVDELVVEITRLEDPAAVRKREAEEASKG